MLGSPQEWLYSMSPIWIDEFFTMCLWSTGGIVGAEAMLLKYWVTIANDSSWH